MTHEFARAKVNLALHITGQRDDGYHLLDSLVVFADIGDRLDFFEANTLSLTVEGPEADAVPSDMNNSILQAASWLKPDAGVAVLLTKNLPTAAGIGGGSADAAATIRGLARHWNVPMAALTKPLEDGEFTQKEIGAISSKVLSLGADVPVCLLSRTARMRGIGELIEPVVLPVLHGVLVNPRVSISTPQVFKAIPNKMNSALTTPPKDAKDVVNWLDDQRNDMEPAAQKLVPEIGACIEAIRGTTDCQLARMSGSGATCFGLFPDANSAQRAASLITVQHPNWWIRSCSLGDP